MISKQKALKFHISNPDVIVVVAVNDISETIMRNAADLTCLGQIKIRIRSDNVGWTTISMAPKVSHLSRTLWKITIARVVNSKIPNMSTIVLDSTFFNSPIINHSQQPNH